MYNGNYKVASLVYIYNVYVCSKTIFSPVIYITSRELIKVRTPHYDTHVNGITWTPATIRGYW